LLDELHHTEGGKPAIGISHHSAGSVHRESAHEDLSKPAPAELFRQGYLFILVSLYSILTLIAWVIICIQNKRPITTNTYHSDSNKKDYTGALAGRMKRNNDWFRAAKVLLAITNSLNILSLPLSAPVSPFSMSRASVVAATSACSILALLLIRDGQALQSGLPF